MSDRLATPDSTSNLMSEVGEQERNTERRKDNAFDNKAIKPANNKTALKQILLDGTAESKEKATFNLSVKILRELEDCWAEARRLSGSKQISKTLMVEKALEMALTEFGLKKQIGKFYDKLVSNKEIMK